MAFKCKLSSLRQKRLMAFLSLLWLILLVLTVIQMSRNPMQSAGCFAILKSVQANPESAVEFLDFSVSDSYPIISHVSFDIYWFSLFLKSIFLYRTFAWTKNLKTYSTAPKKRSQTFKWNMVEKLMLHLKRAEFLFIFFLKNKHCRQSI